MDRTEELLKELTEANGVPGYEHEIRKIMTRELEGNVDEILRDKTGSVVGRKRGNSDDPRIMVIGHMDEIGFMVKEITKAGYIKFLPLGGWWPHVALGQRMRVITAKGPVVGVVGSKPPHLLEADERAKVMKVSDMILDVGVQQGFNVRTKLGIKEGDPIVPDSEFTVMGNRKQYLSKAFDNRMGCAVALDVVRKFQRAKHPNTIFAGGTVQEEVGLRGAQTLAHLIDPDVCFCVDVGVAQDLPPEPFSKREKLGGGPSVLMYDARMIPNLGLRDLVVKTAEDKKIPFHLTVMERGAGDGGPVHLSRLGVPTIYMGAPVRYIHAHNGIMNRTDYDNTVKLIAEVIKKLDKKTVQSFTEG
ncbi:MAG: M42 family metallopeptidase [candidate division Zixibacteria bacterium]|nr:M42 family metallopeptidase [candidate division Zixibacteria bacterium]MDH3939073.1 M42 family metallopeptidase [candidate division Zixibacteria bacterium]MDH4032356.1 M42 family metallopeptidase [candidate division Zixibacteria bacterium]